MNKEKHLILGIHVNDRMHHVPELQKHLSDYGCYIKTRLGLHEVSENYCSPNGIIIIEMIGDQQKTEELMKLLNQIEGVEVKMMSFDHENQ